MAQQFFGGWMNDMVNISLEIGRARQRPDQWQSTMDEQRRAKEERERRRREEEEAARQQSWGDWREQHKEEWTNDEGVLNEKWMQDYYETGLRLKESHPGLSTWDRPDDEHDYKSFGRGTMDKKAWEEMWEDDPLAALSQDPNYSIFGDEYSQASGYNQGLYSKVADDSRKWVGRLRGVSSEELSNLGVANSESIWEREKKVIENAQINRTGRLSAAVGGLAKRVTGNDFVGGMAEGIIMPFETVGAAGVSLQLEALDRLTGQGWLGEAGKAIARDAGVDSRLSPREKGAFILENAGGVAAMMVGAGLAKSVGATALKRFGGAFGEQALARMGLWAGKSGGNKFLAEAGLQAIGGAAVDSPITYGSLRLRGMEHGEAMQWAGMVAAFNVGGAALPVAARAGLKGAGREAAVGLAGYYGAQTLGMDEKDARWIGAGGAALMFGAGRAPSIIDGMNRQIARIGPIDVPNVRTILREGESGALGVDDTLKAPSDVSGGTIRQGLQDLVEAGDQRAADLLEESGTNPLLSTWMDSAPEQGARRTISNILGETGEVDESGFRVMYHGRQNDIDPARKFQITPNYKEAADYARISAQLEGGEPRVYRVEVKDSSLVNLAADSELASSLGSKQIGDSAGIRKIELDDGEGGRTPVYGWSQEPPSGVAPPGGRGGGGAPPGDGGGGGWHFEEGPERAAQKHWAKRMSDHVFGLKDDGSAEYASAADTFDNYITSSREVTQNVMRGKLETVGTRMDEMIPGSSKILAPLKAVDPSLRSAGTVVQGAVAHLGFISESNVRLIGTYIKAQQAINTLSGRTTMQKGARALGTIAPIGGAIGLQWVDLPEPMKEWMGSEQAFKNAMLVAGVGATGLLTRKNPIFKGASALNSIKLQDPNLSRVASNGNTYRVKSSALTKGDNKLIDVILNPDDYGLNGTQRQAVQEIGDMLESALERVQEFEEYAGFDITPHRADRGILQVFTEESVAKAANVHKKTFPTIGEVRPQFAKKLTFERPRDLANNISDAILMYPELKLDGSPIEMIMRDLRDKVYRQANTIMAHTLTSEPEGVGGWVDATEWHTLTEMKSRLTGTAKDLERKALDGDMVASKSAAKLRARIANLSEQQATAEADLIGLGWSREWEAIPGFPSKRMNDAGKAVPAHVMFDRKITASVKALSPELESAFEGFFDKTTAYVRTMLFTADMSPWLTQLPMLAATNFGGFIRSSPAILAASVMGEKFAAKWVHANREFVADASAAGLVNGHWVDELTKSPAAKLPYISLLENRGFQSMLPIARLMVAKHTLEGDRIFRAIDNSSHRSMRWLGSDVGRIGREAIGWGGALYGIKTLTDDDPDSSLEKIFAAAIALSVNPVTISKASEFAGTKLTKAGRNVDRVGLVRIAREMNRSSGILNKAALGINRKQAVTERTLLMNSPAFTRNMFLALKWAATPGPEGAMARTYLLRTGLIAGSIMVGWKLAWGGEMDSLDPTDEDSVFHPIGFAKAEIPGLGKFGTSNPVLSLARACDASPTCAGCGPGRRGPAGTPRVLEPYSRSQECPFQHDRPYASADPWSCGDRLGDGGQRHRPPLCRGRQDGPSEDW